MEFMLSKSEPIGNCPQETALVSTHLSETFQPLPEKNMLHMPWWSHKNEIQMQQTRTETIANQRL